MAARSTDEPSARKGQRAGFPPMGRTTQFGLVAFLVGLGAGDRDDQALGCSFASSKSSATNSERRRVLVVPADSGWRRFNLYPVPFVLTRNIFRVANERGRIYRPSRVSRPISLSLSCFSVDPITLISARWRGG